jgi:hypothetical protein
LYAKVGVVGGRKMGTWKPIHSFCAVLKVVIQPILQRFTAEFLPAKPSAIFFAKKVQFWKDTNDVDSN